MTGGREARLRDGLTHYRHEGPPDGMPIVLLHGATVPCWEFDALVPHLSAAGFRSLRFDFYGHGLSDRPRVDYSVELFARQTSELIDALALPQPFILLGHSLGAAVAAAVATRHAASIHLLVLVAPMLNFNATSAWSVLFRTPLLGELLMPLVGVPALVRRRRKRYARIGLPQLIPLFEQQVSYGGFARVLLSMVRRSLGDQSARYADLAELERRVLLITAGRDAVIPAEHIARIRRLLPTHAYREIADAEHNVLLTHPQAVLATLPDVRRTR